VYVEQVGPAPGERLKINGFGPFVRIQTVYCEVGDVVLSGSLVFHPIDGINYLYSQPVTGSGGEQGWQVVVADTSEKNWTAIAICADTSP
jgi:hypothetical protein